MRKRNRIKVVIDTNLFISFLIGKRLKGLRNKLIECSIELVFAEQNIQELQIVTDRPKFRRYFPKADVADLVKFIRIIGSEYLIHKVEQICRDPKDDFLLALSKKGKANYLVTGDTDLLELKNYHNTQIITVNEFENIINEGT
jgi:putative PIN family toxin of toxin-antitoxin system